MTGPHLRSPGTNDQGFILVFVVGLCLLLAILGATFGRSVQSAARHASLAVERSKAAALADGGIAIARTRLAAGGGEGDTVCSIAGAGVLAIRIEDEHGKVSLNSDNDVLLRALFIGLGVTAEDADRYVALLRDYRDPDSDQRRGGAEREAYVAAGRRDGPKNANFDSVFELDRVMGLPADLRAALKPFVTAVSTRSGIDPDHARLQLLNILAMGGDFGHADLAFGGRPKLPNAFTTISMRSVFFVRAVAATEGARFVRASMISRPVGQGETMRTLTWLQDEVTGADEALLIQSPSPPPC
ncbi:MAG: general secretion pathway protein GspK [Hyphomicrobium sp.]|nr:general secretion pathway protein GspK [Hyphomicrobium sp.]